MTCFFSITQYVSSLCETEVMKLLQANSFARFKTSSAYRQLINDLEHHEGNGRSLHTRGRTHGTTGTTGSGHATGTGIEVDGHSHTGGSPMHAWSTALPPPPSPLPPSSGAPIASSSSSQAPTRQLNHSRLPSVSSNGTAAPSTSAQVNGHDIVSSHIVVAPMIGSLAFGATSAQVSTSSLLPSSRVINITTIPATTTAAAEQANTTLAVDSLVTASSSSPVVATTTATMTDPIVNNTNNIRIKPLMNGNDHDAGVPTLNTPVATL
jgi:hypothetical protein